MDTSKLIDAYFDGGLSPDGFANLQSWVVASPEHARVFMRAALVHDRLRLLLAQDVQDAADDGTILAANIQEMLDEIESALETQRAERENRAYSEAWSEPRDRERPKQRAVATAWTPFTYIAPTVVAAIVVLVMVLQLPRQHGPAAPTVATLGRSQDAQWEDAEVGSTLGGPLQAGPLRLNAGVAEIRFSSGATVILEGPANLDLLSSDSLRLFEGRLVGQVPPGSAGLRVECPTITVTDLGTEFGTYVAPSGSSDVHVLQGAVALDVPRTIVTSAPVAPVELAAGSARRVVVAGGPIQTIAFDKSPFLRRVPTGSYELSVLQSRPLCYWRFSPTGQLKAIDDQGRLAVTIRPSSPTDYRPLEVCEPGNLALYLGPEQGIDLGRHQQLQFASDFTIEAWICWEGAVDLPRRFLSSFSGSNASGHAGFGVGVVSGQRCMRPELRAVPMLSLFGVVDYVWATSLEPDRAYHFAVTVGTDGVPNAYLDGQPAANRLVRFAGRDGAWGELGPGQTMGKIKPGTASLWIGRNPPGDASVPPEAWQGVVDELAIYDRALTQEEVASHWRAAGRDRESHR